MGSVLGTLFLNNLEIPGEIHQFCMELPEYQKLEERARLCLKRLEQLVGFEQSNAVEEALTEYYALEARASYLYGLNLRRELREALFSDAC